MNIFEFLKCQSASTLRDFDPEAYFSYIWFSVVKTIGSSSYDVLTKSELFAVDYLVCIKLKL